MKQRVFVAMFLTALVCAFVAHAADTAVNVWTPLGDGSYPPPRGSWPNITGPALCWIADRDFGLVAPITTETEGREGPGYRRISFDEPKWSFVPGKPPATPDMWDSPRGYTYLPGLKKVLFVKQEWWWSSRKQATAGWLMDPAPAEPGRTNVMWEPLVSPLSMSDRAADFNAATNAAGPGMETAQREGLRLPIWGAVCYDALNQEAVSFGGGGVWGRVGKEKEKVGPGSWIFDEAAKRVRRLTTDDGTTITEARKWYPGNCGTWLFSEAEKKWRPLEQPLGQQPCGRILPGMAYDADAKKIVLFGGDDLARCFDDTWIYDCTKRTWSRIETKVAPSARAAHAMVYVPDQKVILLAGGYGGGWRSLKDVWVFSTAKGEWTKLALELPALAGQASADFDPKRGLVIMAAYPSPRANNKIPVLTLKLDLAAAGKAEPVAANPKSVYHCKVSGGGKDGTDLPDEWLAGAAAPEDPAKTLAELKALPANVWKQLKPPKSVRERNWGWYPYDVRSHRAFAWGGGHCAYAGAEVSEFDVLGNRWRGMDDPTNYNPIWLHGMVAGPPGVSFGGWGLLPTHARKSYGVDPLSDSLINYVGDVYSLKHHRFVGNIGLCPGRYGVSSQVAFVTAPHGLYGYSSGLLAKADVKSGHWEELAKGGPRHNEDCFLVHDTKRDRLLDFAADGKATWSFDFASKTWTEEKPEGKVPPVVLGDGTYVPALDAVLLVFTEAKGAPEKLWFYKCAEKKWYTAPSEGDKFNGVHDNPRDWSPHWDPELGLVVRITPSGFAEWVNVHVLRLDPATLKLTPVE
jgi:hypothetical protein